MKSKVYVLTDGQGRIIRIDGGYTTPEDLTGWVLVDEGCGDKYNLCQSNYLPQPMITDSGVYRYKLAEGRVVERTREEMEQDAAQLPVIPTQLERIEAQTLYTALMTDTLLEV